MRFLLTFVIIFLTQTFVTAQVVPSIGYKISFVNAQSQTYNYVISTQNENRTIDTYLVRSSLNPVAQGINIRSFGGQFLSNRKISFGYSLGLNYNVFSSKSNLIFIGSSTSNLDSLVNAYNDFDFKTIYHTIGIVNYFDLNWNMTNRLKLTNSVGFGVEAVVSASSARTNFNSSIINTNHPVFRLNYQLQITEKYKRVQLGYFLNVNLAGFNMFVNKNLIIPDPRMSFANIRLNGIGIRIIPIPKLKEPLIID